MLGAECNLWNIEGEFMYIFVLMKLSSKQVMICHGISNENNSSWSQKTWIMIIMIIILGY